MLGEIGPDRTWNRQNIMGKSNRIPFSPGKAAAHPPSMPILSTKIIIVFGLREASTYQFREDQTQ